MGVGVGCNKQSLDSLLSSNASETGVAVRSEERRGALGSFGERRRASASVGVSIYATLSLPLPACTIATGRWLNTIG